MNDILVSIVISVLMVLLEYFMLLFVKYRVAQQIENKNSKEQIFAGIKANKPYAEILEQDSIYIQGNRKYLFFQAIPGPEICFIAITIEITLLIIVESLTVQQKIALSPVVLAGNKSIVILIIYFIISILAWIITSFWRERIVSKIQEKYIKRSFTVIIFIATLCLGLCIHIFVGGR